MACNEDSVFVFLPQRHTHQKQPDRVSQQVFLSHIGQVGNLRSQVIRTALQKPSLDDQRNEVDD